VGEALIGLFRQFINEAPLQLAAYAKSDFFHDIAGSPYLAIGEVAAKEIQIFSSKLWRRRRTRPNLMKLCKEMKKRQPSPFACRSFTTKPTMLHTFCMRPQPASIGRQS
jgi:hypothetical protein